MKTYSILCCASSSLPFADKIQIGIFIVGTITAFILWRTIKEGQRQSKAALAINQYNIYHKELIIIIENFMNMNFKKDMLDHDVSINNIFPNDFLFTLGKANGCNDKMISLFRIFLPPFNSQRTKDQEYYFQDYIMKPLVREYEHLLHFLEAIKNDLVLSKEYQSMFYEKIEFELLQPYLRICNNNPIRYDLSCFPPHWVNEFYCINKFYIDNKAFRFKDLAFYIRTL